MAHKDWRDENAIRARWYFGENGFGVSVEEYADGEYCIMRGDGEDAGSMIDTLTIEDMAAIGRLIAKAVKGQTND